MTERIEQTISSVEVARMMGKDHDRLLKDIRRYTDVLNRVKIDEIDFWREATYTDRKGRRQPCYDVTKKGCEFIAHKMTGEKGTVFTALYINRFHEMEEAIADARAIPASRSFAVSTKNDKYKARANWFAYMLDVLEAEIGLTGENMLHQSYEAMKNEGLDIEAIKRQYMGATGKADFSTFEAVLHDRTAAAELADILCRNMRITLIQKCLG